MMWVSEHAMLFQVDTKVKSQEDFMTQLKMLQNCIKKKIGK